MTGLATFEAGDVTLQSGVVLPDVKLVYRTHGQLNAARDNAILYPTHYMGNHDSNAWAIAPGMALDPQKYFIIIPNMLGNGVSSSPSNTPAPFDGPRFPLVTVRDNVLLQHRLVTEVFGISTLQLVLGHSMGALQTFQWGALFPDMVQRIAPFCGAARVSRHNWLFLEGAKCALMADAAFAGGDYAAPPVAGIRAFARVYAGWAWSQTFFRQQLDRERLGLPSMEDFLQLAWEPFFQTHDANNLLAMLATWQAADISADPRFDGDFARALAAITAKAFVMPCRSDLYFPPEDSEIEVGHMPHAQLRVIPSVWGHMAGGGMNPEDMMFINTALAELLAH
ncbi:alpha/beta fold hydrolase [Sandarakinorhabdus sp. AAP62]|uniref:alpha/beta fold hydrolase n=1 Tax=Sandarakinorhabdus sp. AAP62 TaxID=1248916 RepID=UPI0002EE923B|nr:alpha/beta fold hydrolase [Sandarakinorhabdus sp. AAP62]